jgi:hypothetical protein
MAMGNEQYYGRTDLILRIAIAAKPMSLQKKMAVQTWKCLADHSKMTFSLFGKDTSLFCRPGVCAVRGEGLVCVL